MIFPKRVYNPKTKMLLPIWQVSQPLKVVKRTAIEPDEVWPGKVCRDGQAVSSTVEAL